MSYFSSRPSSPSQSRTPRPSRIGTIAKWAWSMTPAARNSRMTVGPPPIRMSLPPAASRVVLPSGVAELAGPHDLGPDSLFVALHEDVVDAGAAARLPRSGLEHPLVQ